MTNTTKKWIWEHRDYPNFPYDKEKLKEKLRQVEYLRGMISGILSFADKTDIDELEITNITDEIISTSQIEGEYLRRESVRDSVAKAINRSYTSSEDMSTRHTDDLTQLMLDSTRNTEPLSVERIHGWHNALFSNTNEYEGVKKINIATFRNYDDMKVVENIFGREGQTVKYIAPPYKFIDKDIEALLLYCNTSDENPYIKGALIHLWFVSIHPYDDGNGRISRAMADYTLSTDTSEKYKIYSMSTAIYAKRVEYYKTLDMTTNLHKNRHYDFTLWIEWNIDILISALENTHENILFIIKKTKFWDRHRGAKLTKPHVQFLNSFIDSLARGNKNSFSNNDYRDITKVSPVTASRHIKKLLEYGFIEKVEGTANRNARYVLLFDEKYQDI